MVLFITHSPCRSSDIQRRLASSLFGISQDNSETQAGCASPRGGPQDRIQPTFLQDRRWGDVKHEAPGRRWARPRCSPGVMLHLLLWAEPLVFGTYLCPDFQNWQHAIARLFACVITVIVTTVVVKVQANNQLHIQTGRWHFLHRAPNSISSYTSRPEHPQQYFLCQCSPVQCHSVLPWQGNKLYNLIRHFPSVPQNGAFWRQRRR